MGKIQSAFDFGWPGSISRSVDDIVVSLKNADTKPIPFGAPVFLVSGGDGVVAFDTSSPQDYGAFVGFAVRIADKTPEAYPEGQFGEQPEGEWKPGDVMEVLVRGSIIIRATAGFAPGGKVYIRKLDGRIVALQGAEGSTVELQNVRIKRPQTGSGSTSEAVVLERHIL